MDESVTDLKLTIDTEFGDIKELCPRSLIG